MAAPVQVEPRDTLRKLMMEQLMAQVDKLESTQFSQESHLVDPAPQEKETAVTGKRKQKVIVCFRCGQQGHFA